MDCFNKIGVGKSNGYVITAVGRHLAAELLPVHFERRENRE
jgi:hypothetical protein